MGLLNITGYLRVVAREVANPTAEVANQVYNPPQPTTLNIIVPTEGPDLNPVPHYFDFYESIDGISIGTLLSTFEIDVGKVLQTAFTIYEFTVDGPNLNDPPANTNIWNNTALAGIPAAQIVANQRGIGPRSFTDEITDLDTGGIQLQGSETFTSGDKWFVMVSNTIEIQTPPPVSKGLYTDILPFTGSFPITNIHYYKLLEANGPSSNILTITFPALSGIPDNVLFGITTQYGLQRYVAVQLQTGDFCRLMGVQKNKFWLGRGEDIMFIKKGTLLKVGYYNGDYLRLGEIVEGNTPPLNSLAETGGWKLYSDYPRLFYDYINLIPTGELAAKANIDALVATELTKFSIDNAGSRFWMPDTGGYFKRNTDPNNNIDFSRTTGNYTGSVQHAGVGPHVHSVIPPDSNSDSGYGKSATGNDATEGTGITPFATEFNTANTSGSAAENIVENIAVKQWRII